MTETRKHKVDFICQDDRCMEEGTGGCVLSYFIENGLHDPDTPNYCPYEISPADHKFVPWRLLK